MSALGLTVSLSLFSTAAKLTYLPESIPNFFSSFCIKACYSNSPTAIAKVAGTDGQGLVLCRFLEVSRFYYVLQHQ